MTKLCVFVEGNGEAVFVKRLAEFLFADGNATIVSFTLSGGRRYPRMEMQRRETILGSGADAYIQIVNSANEDRAVSDARDQAKGLADAEFDQIIVLRDVAPNFSRAEIGKLRVGIAASLSGQHIPTHAFLQIMEFEAWLLSMADHYAAINPCLTVDAIVGEVGFLPDCANCQEIDRPSAVYAQILALAGIFDTKSHDAVSRVMDAFDVGLLIDDRSNEINDLAQLVERLKPTGN